MSGFKEKDDIAIKALSTSNNGVIARRNNADGVSRFLHKIDIYLWADAKGSRKNKLPFFGPRFGLSVVDVIERNRK